MWTKILRSLGGARARRGARVRWGIFSKIGHLMTLVCLCFFFFFFFIGAPSGSPGHGYASGRVVRRPLGMSGELG